ncbi:MAG TPA: hypothetical protein VD997_04585 [Phycisphaerales bacterium]|nr:hypothetical protein [Phycisphaerales bacterium]
MQVSYTYTLDDQIALSTWVTRKDGPYHKASIAAFGMAGKLAFYAVLATITAVVVITH